MARRASNKNLQKAKKSKSDEFYTQLCDIERELQHYPDCFLDKTIYCNCDDPKESNFFRFFKENFKELGLRKLIASCYKEKKCDLFSTTSNEKAYYCIYEGDDAPTQTVYFKGGR